VAIAPVTDWKFYDCAYTERYMGTPAANPAGYASTSLLDVASRISGSLLLAHGLADDNVHAQNTLELVKRLNAANIHYKLLMYPDKNHNIGGTRLHLFEEVCKFLIESLK
jgi:dipeptidyl-peptidase-4